jgi:ATP/maltotriose-dependent transcriptional regulator MalT
MVLAEARAARAACDWPRARDLLDKAVTTTPSAEAERLDALGEALWWLGRIDECIDARARAYALFGQNGSHSRAGQTAVWLYEHHCFLGRPAMAGGWLRRARRSLEGDEESLAWGNLLLREAEQFHGAGELGAAIDNSTDALALARRLTSTDLEAEALQTTGRILIDAGRHQEGMAHLDEAMLLAVEGRLGPYATGKVHCSVIGACEAMGDLRRAAEWTEAASRWAAHHPFAVFPGLCRVKRAEVLQRQGDWQEAEREARLACEELASVNVGSAATAWVEVGEIRRRIGDVDGAEEAFGHADELCCTPTAGLALLRLAQGRPAEAASIIDDALTAGANSPLTRARLLPAKVQVSVQAGRLDEAAAAVDELERLADRYGSDAFAASAALARGRLQLAAGHPSACATLRRAVEQWRQLEVPYEAASAQLLLGEASRVAGDREASDTALRSAIATFDRLGAAYDARHARELRGGHTMPAGLTEREAEVLRFLARGCTNKDIARTLRLSDRTIARHLSNIFAKTGATTRSAATAFAFESGIVTTTPR